MSTGVLARPTARAARPAGAVDQRRLAAVGLTAVTALAALLRFAGFGAITPNPFYDAAVRSMGQSWHNLFYGAFEPGGQVSVDKIPVDLWLQVASVKLFGFSSTALRLPEALAATAAVPLLYAVVRRLFGRAAGLAAALALAVLPVSVLTGRSDTMDSVMMALLVAAALLVVAGAQRRRTALLAAGGVVAGLAFNVKLFEALIALPALAALALLALDGGVRERARALAVAAAAFVASSLSWLVAVSLAGAARRPWPIGSTNGSVWNVVFGFNGIDRLRDPATAGVRALDPPGALRLLGTGGRGYGLLIGSLLIGAVVLGALAAGEALLGARRAERARPASPSARARRAGAAWIAIWLGTGLVLFSLMARVQTRYLEAFTPAVAAAAGVGVAMLAAAAVRRPPAAAALAAGALATALLAPTVAGAPGWAATLAGAGALATAALAIAAIARRGGAGASALRGGLTAAALVAVLAVPLAGAAQIASSRASNSGRPGAMPAAQVAALSRYLRAHQGRARYEVASSSVAKAGPLIARDGRPVLMLTSFHGRPLLTPARLAALVRRGQVRYALLGRGTCSPRSTLPCAPVLRWARDHATDVSARAGLGRAGVLWRLGSARTR